ncbi:alpha/beta hydrolase family protein [Tateyamaria sp.]|uniref:alpha/beta hydrolase family protein n=1 Tax=Tateyamaria sp. TaxID=1929288 RepID=UPI00329C7020
MNNRATWTDTLSGIGEENGFFRQLGDMHNALYIKGDKTLVVTFDNLDDARQDKDGQMPWGSNFVSSQGWSSLGIGAHGWTWYRDEAVLDFFDELRDAGFFDQFDTVVFYGISMGGYAASVFCAAAPGAKVIAMNPQATLDRSVTSCWETRYRRSWRRDFSGRYSFGPDQSANASVVYLIFDPLGAQDAMHAALFQNDNVVKIRCRHFGHRLASVLTNMGILKDTVEICVNETPKAHQIYKLLTVRKSFPGYQKSVLNKLLERKKPLLIHRWSRKVIEMSGNNNRPHFRRAMKQAAEALRADQV